MKKIGLLILFAAVFILACSKEYAGRNPQSIQPNPVCDTCSLSANQTVKEAIIYVETKDWMDRGNGSYDCNLEPLLGASASPISAYSITSIYVGVGRSARQVKPARPIQYDGGSLAWYGYILNFQVSSPQPPPESLTLRIFLRMN